MYAVVVSGGKQFKVSVGDVIEVEKLNSNVGDKIELPAIMTADGDNVLCGESVTAKVKAEVVSHGKGKKIIVFKYKPKKNERKKKGHRQQFTRIKIVKIG